MKIKLKMGDTLENNIGKILKLFPEIIKKENGEWGDFHLYYEIPNNINLNGLKKYLNENNITFELI